MSVISSVYAIPRPSQQVDITPHLRIVKPPLRARVRHGDWPAKQARASVCIGDLVRREDESS